MPRVVLPVAEELVQVILDMLQVLNQPDRRRERYGLPGPRAKVPTAQLEERARNIAQLLITMPAE